MISEKSSEANTPPITAIARDWDDAFDKFFGEGKIFDAIYRP